MRAIHPALRFALAALFSAAALLPLSALALENFVSLAPIPGVSDQPTLSGFLSAVFRIGIIVAAFLAVIMIAFGGLEYMVSSVPGIKTAGIERMKNALWGLLLILFAYIVLNTINPDILNFRFESSLQSGRLTGKSDFSFGTDAGGPFAPAERTYLPTESFTNPDSQKNFDSIVGETPPGTTQITIPPVPPPGSSQKTLQEWSKAIEDGKKFRTECTGRIVAGTDPKTKETQYKCIPSQ